MTNRGCIARAGRDGRVRDYHGPWVSICRQLALAPQKRKVKWTELCRAFPPLSSTPSRLLTMTRFSNFFRALRLPTSAGYRECKAIWELPCRPLLSSITNSTVSTPHAVNQTTVSTDHSVTSTTFVREGTAGRCKCLRGISHGAVEHHA